MADFGSGSSYRYRTPDLFVYRGHGGEGVQLTKEACQSITNALKETVQKRVVWFSTRDVQADTLNYRGLVSNLAA